MASVQFQIHTDKENATSMGFKATNRGLQGGKSFQTHKTPRRALGSVNEAHRVGFGVKPPVSGDLKSNRGSLSAQPLKPKLSATEKDSRLKQHQDKENAVKKGKQHGEKKAASQPVPPEPQQINNWCLPDIEYMPPPSPPRDEDEDILPMKERASTYVNRLFSWRPQCLFGTDPDSEEEAEDERERRRIMAELDNLPALNEDPLPAADLHLSCEELDVEGLELPTLEEMLIPDVQLDTSVNLEVSGSCDTSVSQHTDSTNMCVAHPNNYLPKESDSTNISPAQQNDFVDRSVLKVGDSAESPVLSQEDSACSSGCVSVQNESANSSLSQLDDSVNTASLRQLEDSMLGLENHLGSLQMKDDSCPPTPSH